MIGFRILLKSTSSFAVLGCAVLLAGGAAFAADVTPDRLANPEPGNWLVNHRTYDSQRYSPLEQINKANVKSLKLAYAVAIGGTSANENLESTPLAEDGFLYVTDQWACSTRRCPLATPAASSGGWIRAGEDGGRQSRCCAVGKFRRHHGELSAARDRHQQDRKVAWETNLSDGQANLEFTAAPSRSRTRS